MAKRIYYREPASAPELRARADALLEASVITEELATAIYIAVDHQAQLDYDGLQEEYVGAPEEVRQLLIDSGVIIVLTEEQTRAVKYGV